MDEFKTPQGRLVEEEDAAIAVYFAVALAFFFGILFATGFILWLDAMHEQHAFWISNFERNW